jgi:hypothetical protein
MILRRVLLLVFGCTAFCGLAGLILGFLSGKFLPQSYYFFFGERDFDPLAVGIMLGMVQGICFGALVGVAISAIVTWHDVRMAQTRARNLTE